MILAARILPIAACLALPCPPQEIVVRRPPELPKEIQAWRASLPEGRPALRGFLAPVLDRRGETAPFEVPGDEVSRRCADLVARGLARDGILATTAAAIEALVTAVPALGAEDVCAPLRAIGLPTDWLECFRAPGGDPAGAIAIVRSIAAKLAAGATADAVRGELGAYVFAFRPSVGGFEVATETGEHAIDLVRLQISSGTYWTGVGDGGCLDMVRQLLQALPQARFVASVEEKHLEGLLDAARSWSVIRPDRLTVIPEVLPVAQWAQDNGKPGFAPRGSPAGSRESREVITLVPRYASRGEDGAAFVPGETFLLDGFASAGNRAVQSPLLFQGGDLLAARDPRSGERILFLGEANVWRNTALGLSRSQVLEAFRLEFGVDRCVVLAAVSFHIDQEVTLRSAGDRLVAFVADPAAAVRVVLQCGLGALETAGILDSSRIAKARADLEGGSDREFLETVFPAVVGKALGFGRYPESLAASFSNGGADSGVANLQRFLLALDLLISWSIPVDELSLDPHSIAYLRSFNRRDEDRRALVAELQGLGIEIVRVPSLPEGSRGIDYLNGLQEPNAYWMPAWGGFFEPLDRAAENAFRRALGPGIEIRPVLTSESQRRGGALHCSISNIPRP